ncbi:MAG: porphobilinogen synthase [Firmicutes bacterium]|nr:porphobilinogen synthase [Bacillota bacterium]
MAQGITEQVQHSEDSRRRAPALESVAGQATGAFPVVRMRRLRRSAVVRDLVRETALDLDDLIYPLFVVPGSGIQREIPSLPGQYHWSVDRVAQEAERLAHLGIRALLLFGIPASKDPEGSQAWCDTAPVQQAIRAIKAALPDMLVITDVCLCEYTSHGHCGHLSGQEVDNDATLPLLARTAVSHARAGADMVAPSDMMDGRVGAIRRALDEAGFTETAIMAYSAKYASAFYGPFRDAAGSAPSFGNRRGYQMDPGNAAEALREVQLDMAEGADIVMVKPALPYLDVLRRVKDTFAMPTAAYNVSGEYAMIRAAVDRGWLDERTAVWESLLGIKRAGADLIITYWAPQVAAWLQEGWRP